MDKPTGKMRRHMHFIASLCGWPNDSGMSEGKDVSMRGKKRNWKQVRVHMMSLGHHAKGLTLCFEYGSALLPQVMTDPTTLLESEVDCFKCKTLLGRYPQLSNQCMTRALKAEEVKKKNAC
jgi:hypothetical protein